MGHLLVEAVQRYNVVVLQLSQGRRVVYLQQYLFTDLLRICIAQCGIKLANMFARDITAVLGTQRRERGGEERRQ